MEFMTGLPLSVNWKGDNYDSILVIVDCLTKMMHYKPIQVIINALRLAEVILDVVIRHYGLPDFIIGDCGAIFISKFWFSLCYILGIKRQLSIAFQFQTNG